MGNRPTPVGSLQPEPVVSLHPLERRPSQVTHGANGSERGQIFVKIRDDLPRGVASRVSALS